MIIDISDLRFSYAEKPNSPVLHIPSWSLSTGEKSFIVGASGTGKSTFLNIISGLYPVSDGSIKILGQRLDTMSNRQRDRFRANNIGYVFQQFNLIPYLNALDNIKLASQFSLTHSKARSTLNQEISELLVTLNMSQSDWRKPMRSLSIGQQQRVAIARALINKPKLLIADEPTSSLDVTNRDAFMQLLMSMVEKHNISLLFVSHDNSLSKYFDKVESLEKINDIKGAQ